MKLKIEVVTGFCTCQHCGETIEIECDVDNVGGNIHGQIDGDFEVDFVYCEKCGHLVEE